MTLESIKLGNRVYKYYNPSSYAEYKKLQEQIKRVRAKLRACELPSGAYYGKVTSKGEPHYKHYPILVKHLESILNK